MPSAVLSRRIAREVEQLHGAQEANSRLDCGISLEAPSCDGDAWTVSYRVDYLHKSSTLRQSLERAHVQKLVFRVSYPEQYPYEHPIFQIVEPQLHGPCVKEGGFLMLSDWSIAVGLHPLLLTVKIEILDSAKEVLKLGPGTPTDVNMILAEENGPPTVAGDLVDEVPTCTTVTELTADWDCEPGEHEPQAMELLVEVNGELHQPSSAETTPCTDAGEDMSPGAAPTDEMWQPPAAASSTLHAL